MVAITFEPNSLAPGTAVADGSTIRRGHLHLVPRASRSTTSVVGYVVAALLLALAFGYLAMSPATDTPSGVAVADTTYVASAGDTMWSIADDVAPAGTASAYVERLVEANGTSVVEPGQVVLLPTS